MIYFVLILGIRILLQASIFHNIYLFEYCADAVAVVLVVVVLVQSNWMANERSAQSTI